MTDFQAYLLTTLICLVGIAGLIVTIRIAKALIHRKVSVRTLFVGLRQKLFMTACLGLFFFGFYAAIVWLISYWLNFDMRQKIFELAYQNPQQFIYGALLLFMTISLSILGVRSIIKRVYNTYFR